MRRSVTELWVYLCRLYFTVLLCIYLPPAYGVSASVVTLLHCMLIFYKSLALLRYTYLYCIFFLALSNFYASLVFFILLCVYYPPAVTQRCCDHYFTLALHLDLLRYCRCCAVCVYINACHPRPSLVDIIYYYYYYSRSIDARAIRWIRSRP